MSREPDARSASQGASRSSTSTTTKATAGNPQSTNRNKSKTTQTATVAYDGLTYLKSKTYGYKYENTWDPKHFPEAMTPFPVADPGTGTPVQTTFGKGSIVAANLSLEGPTVQNAAPSGQNDYKFNFFYNPTQIDIQNQLYTDTYPPGAVNSDKQFAGAFPATEAISWSILLDRTQDAYYDRQSHGTIQDLWVLYGVINGGDPGWGYNLGYLFMTPVTVFFNVPDIAAIGNVLAYTGYITNIGISHQRFNQAMVPNLTTIDFALTRISMSSPLGDGSPQEPKSAPGMPRNATF